jgi:hypothetical protein
MYTCTEEEVDCMQADALDGKDAWRSVLAQQFSSPTELLTLVPRLFAAGSTVNRVEL